MWDSPKTNGAPSVSGASHFPTSPRFLALWYMRRGQRQQIREQPVRPDDPGGKFAEEGQSRVHVRPAAGGSDEEATGQRRVPRVADCEDRGIGGGPVVGGVQPALLA